ncbi:rCG21936, partial [Rattus norvegicus]
RCPPSLPGARGERARAGRSRSRTPVGWGVPPAPAPPRVPQLQLRSRDPHAPPPSLGDLRPLRPTRRGDRGAGVQGCREPRREGRTRVTLKRGTGSEKQS